MSRARITTAIAELAAEWQLPQMELDENDFLCIDVDGLIINIDYFEEAECLSIYSTVAEVPNGKRAECFDLMLRANYGWQKTAGAVLAVDPSETLALLRTEVTLNDLDLPVLLNRMDEFTTTVKHWADRLEQL